MFSLAGAALAATLVGASDGRANDVLGLSFVCKRGECRKDFTADVEAYLGCGTVMADMGDPTPFSDWQWPLKPDVNLVIGYGSAVANLRTAELVKFSGVSGAQTLTETKGPGCARLDRLDDGQTSVFVSLFQWEDYAGLTVADKSCLDTFRQRLPKPPSWCAHFNIGAPE